MIGFGLAIGLLFPFFMLALGVRSSVALTPTFFGACLGAGAAVGAINYGLAKQIVGSRLRALAAATHRTEESLRTVIQGGDPGLCDAGNCMVPADSDDEIGESARAFNHLVETLVHSLDTQSAVRSFFEMLTSTLELETLAENTIGQFIEHTGASGGLIFYEEDGKMSVAACRGLKEPGEIASSDIVLLAFRRDESQVVKLPPDLRVDGVLADFQPQEALLLPVSYRGVPLGVVVLGTAGHFDADQRTRAELFRQGFGLALNNALVHERLQRLAALDPLTGVYNRRFGLGRLHEEFERAVRAATPLGVLMMDIDHFKAVNDTYGHPVGDRVLQTIARSVRTALREGDILVRYGGEEFLAVLPAASRDDLALIGERMRRSVEDCSVADGQQTIRVTLSLGGAALLGQNVANESSLVELADSALYRAKQTGRNKVEIVK